MQVPVLITFKSLVGSNALIGGHGPDAGYACNALTAIRVIPLLPILFLKWLQVPIKY